jgi:hypothetical protein
VISEQETNQATSRPGFRLSLPAACALLAGATLAAAIVVGWYAHARQQTTGLEAALEAAVTCWLSATGALIVGGLLAGTPNAVSGILGGTLLRLAGPLLVTAANGAAGTPVYRAGLFGYMVVFFLYTLAVETLLLVSVIGGGLAASGAAARGPASRGY